MGLLAVTASSLTLMSGCGNGQAPKWKNCVFYEILVRSFYDSDGDGIGDLKGITEKLDYLKAADPDRKDSLGIDGIWLMPIYASPTYHGYDVTDYYAVNPDYGTLDDFRELTEEAHKRGIKVILDLPINNTSDKHPWFLESASSPDSPKRDWFIWAEDQGLSMKRAGVFGSKSWHESGGTHYMGIYHDSMPDLNYDSPEVREEMVRVGRFWLEQGADGFRLDSAKHLYWKYADSGKDPATSRNNVAWWQEFRRGLNGVNPDAYLVGEIWDTNSVIAPFLNRALDSGFNFELGAKLVEMARSEKAEDIGFRLNRVHEMYERSSGGAYADAPFLTNHDQDRVMSQLEGNLHHAKTAAALLLTLPGNPFLYYGEELGMMGVKPDERIREPMVWSGGGKKEPGQTVWEPYAGEVPLPPVEQAGQGDSLFSRYRTLIGWRHEETALREGKIDSYGVEHDHVAVYIRYTDKERLLVAHNLSGRPQELQLKPGSPDAPAFTEVARATESGWSLNDGLLSLPPYGSVILKSRSK